MSQALTPAGAPIQTCAEDDQCVALPCAQCLDEIPDSLADNPEAPDYVAHYCGMDCLAEWQDKQARQVPRPDEAPKPEGPAGLER